MKIEHKFFPTIEILIALADETEAKGDTVLDEEKSQQYLAAAKIIRLAAQIALAGVS